MREGTCFRGGDARGIQGKHCTIQGSALSNPGEGTGVRTAKRALCGVGWMVTAATRPALAKSRAGFTAKERLGRGGFKAKES